MKSKIITLVMMLLFLGAGTLSFAQGMEGMTGHESMAHKGMKMGAEGQEKGRMGMCPMMGMMQKSLVATSDGGVVVLMRNKLMKYDKDLNLVKEVEIKIDMAAMQKEMMKNCPMMKGDMMPKGSGAMEPGQEMNAAAGAGKMTEQK